MALVSRESRETWAPKDRAGRINRLEGALLLAVYVAYTLTLLKSAGAF